MDCRIIQAGSFEIWEITSCRESARDDHLEFSRHLHLNTQPLPQSGGDVDKGIQREA